jgi:NADPH2:quinone reductase
MAEIAVATAFGGPDVVQVLTEATAALGGHDVLLGVRAIGTNPIDFKAYSGMFGTDPAQLPIRLGTEAAGVVLEVGADVRSVSVGDEVIAFPATGAYASEFVVAETSLTPKPESVGWSEAAGLMVTGATAIHTLVAARVGANDTVLIHGASGGVGLFAVQLAVRRGATVIATARESAHPVLSSLGAMPVTYGAGLIDRVRALAPNGVDVALDLVGTDEAVDVSLELVADRSRIVTIAAFGRGAKDGIQVLGGAPGADPGTEIRNAARAELADLAGAGTLRILVAKAFPLTEVAQAHRELKGAHAPGKIVLVP